MSQPTDPIELDPNAVAAAMSARYLQIIGQLVEKNAQLEVYVAQLTKQQQPPAD